MKEDCEPNQFQKDWKNYPIRLTENSTCSECGKSVFLAQVLDGGLVWRCCSSCSWKEKLPEDVFFAGLSLWVNCPRCMQRMNPSYLRNSQKSEKGNYGFFCGNCEIGIEFHELLPQKSDHLALRHVIHLAPRGH